MPSPLPLAAAVAYARAVPTVDLILGALLACGVAWGVRTGLAGTLTVAGFAVGAMAGAGLAPLALSGGHDNAFALAVALPAGLLLGGLLAAAVERRVPRVRRRLKRQRPASAIGGGAVGAGVALAAAWLAGAALVQMSSLQEPIEDSAVVGALDTILGRPGPAVPPPQAPRADLFPTLAGTGPQIGGLDPDVVRDPDVLRADHSLVNIFVQRTCGASGGSGWIGASGVVVTNAHVVMAAEKIGIRAQGSSRLHPATAIWWDPRNDVAVLRAPSLRALPVLRTVRRPRSGTSGAILGFPLGRHAIRPARIGRTTKRLRGTMEFDPIMDRRFPRKLPGRLVTTFRGVSRPGNSGGPIVDERGQVLAMVFGGRGASTYGMAVPIRFVRRALRDAGPPVETGSCNIPGR